MQGFVHLCVHTHTCVHTQELSEKQSKQVQKWGGIED